MSACNSPTVFSQFPQVRTFEAFSRQGNIIGLSIMCKQFIQLIHAIREDEDGQVVYKSGSSPKTIPEKQMLYEIFTGLETRIEVEERQFQLHRVISIHQVKRQETRSSDQ